MEDGWRLGEGGLQVDSPVPVLRRDLWCPLQEPSPQNTDCIIINIYTHNLHCTQHTFTRTYTLLYTCGVPPPATCAHTPERVCALIFLLLFLYFVFFFFFLVFKRDSLSQKELHHWHVRVSAAGLGWQKGGVGREG